MWGSRLPGTSLAERAFDMAAWHFNGCASQLDDEDAEFALSRVSGPLGIDTVEDLAAKLYERTFDILGANLAEALDRDRDPLRAIRAFLKACLDPGRPELAAPGTMCRLRPEDQVHLTRKAERLIHYLTGALSVADANGMVRVGDVPTAARLILTMVLWLPAGARMQPISQLAPKEFLAAAFYETLLVGRSTDRVSRFRPMDGLVPTDGGFGADAVNGYGATHLSPQVLAACHDRALDVFATAASAAESAHPTRGAAVFLTRIVEAYLCGAPLIGPQAGWGGLAPPDVALLRPRYRAQRRAFAEMRQRLVTAGTLRSSFGRHGRTFMWTLCAALASELWNESRAQTRVQDIVDVILFGMRPSDSDAIIGGRADRLH